MGRRLQPPDATQLAVLREHSWPGNVRELRNVIERAIILAENDRPSIERAMVGQGRSSVPGKTPEAVLTNRELLELERKNMERALEICQGRISGPKGTAQLLGIPPSTLSSRMKTLGIRSSR
jgi:DNA-binding NtrC family response regulator